LQAKLEAVGGGMVEIIDAFSRRNRLNLGRDDIFLATAWWTAHVANGAITSHRFHCSQFIYLIQDYEPGFYPWSEDYALARSTYELSNFLPVFNSEYLADFFRHNGFSRSALTLQPEIDDRQFFPPHVDNLKQRRIKRILFYGRPAVHRNLFPMIISSLDRWVAFKGLSPSDVEIVSAGGTHRNIACPNGVQIQNAGLVRGERYPQFLRGFDIGISLMMSPHPSYPPLEMAKCGLITVTNRFANKDLSELSSNIISCDVSHENLIEAFDNAWLFSSDCEARIRGSRFHFGRARKASDIVDELLGKF